MFLILLQSIPNEQAENSQNSASRKVQSTYTEEALIFKNIRFLWKLFRIFHFFLKIIGLLTSGVPKASEISFSECF